ncbi:fructuronate reductase [Marinitenerispora sediminis]|uniref:Mannitol-1-phosphate 5-dehydrogenase n=1 Tax=Marinitenerispora sediminis TaxID=1931232 RepID=A0A368TBN3_9ACTN|nr:fructuronate reductase [Marinitenerispora sediminis]RCV57380.1 fructuronate reductase [Marinitenerispora sediminis]RCV62386.1 fructuronate reductase [Marinitenerispora sediminis]
MQQPISAATLPPGVRGHHRTGLGTGQVHLGLGNFHRAHQAVYTAAALAEEDGPWGVHAFASRSRAVVAALREQDLLSAVLEISPGGTAVTVPAVHTRADVAADDPAAVVAAIGAEATRVVTLTVTENGYTYSPATQRLDLDDPGVRHDLRDGRAPTTVVGQLVRGLQHRLRSHAAPVTILSCDNLSANGERTASLVREFAAELPAAEQAELLPWLDRAVAFPSSMVDRIVPATTGAHREAVGRRLGLRDLVPVPAEPFSMWVLEDAFAAGRPRWEAGGALFTDHVEPYELLKLRLLNGTHSLIAYLGALAGAATIPDAVARPFVEQAARAVLLDEYAPTLTVPDGVDLDSYVAQLFGRWANTALGHRTSQVGGDGSVKLAQRVPEPALFHLANGGVPQHLALTVAAYLCCVAPRPGADPGPHAAAMRDPARERLAERSARTGSTRAFVEGVLAEDHLLTPDVGAERAFVERVAELVDVITAHGPEAAAAEASAATATATGA